MFKKIVFTCALSFANTIYSAEPPLSSQNAPESTELKKLADTWSAYARRQLYRPDQAVLRNLRALLRQTFNPRYMPGRQFKTLLGIALLVAASVFCANNTPKRTDERLFRLIPSLLLILQGLYDRNLSSGQLRQKNWWRRFAGLLLRHKLLFSALFGHARGSEENAERLLSEFSTLPDNAPQATKVVYLDELSDHLERLKAGTEEENAVLAKRIEAILKLHRKLVPQHSYLDTIDWLFWGVNTYRSA